MTRRMNYKAAAWRGDAANRFAASAADRDERQVKPRIVYTHWHRVVKDGVTLSYGGDLSAAKRHAARCGGTVISTPRKK